MWTYIFIGAASTLLAVYLFYRFLTRKPRSAVKYVARMLNVKPQYVANMLEAMGMERGNMFIAHMTTWKDETGYSGAYTFVVYQILKNDHLNNIKWWKDKLIENDINPDMGIEDVTTAFMYLRYAGADLGDTAAFLDNYKRVQ